MYLPIKILNFRVKLTCFFYFKFKKLPVIEMQFWLIKSANIYEDRRGKTSSVTYTQFQENRTSLQHVFPLYTKYSHGHNMELSDFFPSFFSLKYRFVYWL